MVGTLCWLLVLISLAGCAGGIGSSIKQLSRDGKFDIGQRMELKVELDELMTSDEEPCPHRREIYDQRDKSGSVFEQSFALLGTFKF